MFKKIKEKICKTITNVLSLTGLIVVIHSISSAAYIPPNTSVITNNSFLQLCTRYGIPAPFAWYAADRLTNTVNGQSVTLWPDFTQNPSNNLVVFTNAGWIGAGGSSPSYNKTIMNGLPGVIGGAYSTLTNSALFLHTTTNYTILI